MKSEFLCKRAARPSRSDLSSASTALPTDLIEQSSRRLGLAAVIYACAYTLSYGSARLTQDLPEHWGNTAIYWSDAAAAFFVGLSVAVFFLVRSGRLTGPLALDLGLVYEVIGAAGIEIGIVFLREWPAGPAAVGLSWTCVWIVVFPLLVPTTTGKTLVAALLAALMQPLMYAIAVSSGLEPLPGNMLFLVVFPTFICVGIALVASRVVYGLGTDIDEARRMGSYQLHELLGRGGMGEVWRAEHQMLARSAAVKLIRSDGSGTGSGETTESNLMRFEREAQATAQLRSPHTIQIYDFGITEDRTFYYVMELLDGISLEELVTARGPLPSGRAIHVLTQVCHSLAEAHERGLVHRDIKPANIFLCRYGREFDFVKVLDFGLVKRVGEQPEDEAGITMIGSFIGTPSYGSPELASGSPEADPRSDIYSLGCVAFWLLTGRPVFQAPTLPLLLVKHINEEAEPPSRHAKTQVPAALDALVLDCLRKDKNDRPQSADAIAERLAAIEVPPWTSKQALEWWGNYRPATPIPMVADTTERR
jgi:serine/threonine-protein kinase